MPELLFVFSPHFSPFYPLHLSSLSFLLLRIVYFPLDPLSSFISLRPQRPLFTFTALIPRSFQVAYRQNNNLLLLLSHISRKSCSSPHRSTHHESPASPGSSTTIGLLPHFIPEKMAQESETHLVFAGSPNYKSLSSSFLHS